MLNDLSDAMKAVCCFAINNFGDNDHPVAAAERTLQYFRVPYVRRCLERMSESDKVAKVAKDLAELALERLEEC
jgi:hypothetical protein